MKYIDALRQKQINNICPFCDMNINEVIFEGKYCIVTASRAPYAKHHILIVSKRHVSLLSELNHQEAKEFVMLTQNWNTLLHKKYSDVVIYIKDAKKTQGPSHKTVEHLHVHLIPDYFFAATTVGEQREFLDQAAFIKLNNKIKKTFLNL